MAKVHDTIPTKHPFYAMRLILASQSPRRRQLLKEAGYDFDVVVPSENAEDSMLAGESAEAMVARFAQQKAESVAQHVGDGIVIGCDTVAEMSGEVLGKPANKQHARAMLRKLRGGEHLVHSGLCLLRRPGNVTRVQVATTILLMKNLSNGEIEEYLASDQWIGKAGGFGLQDRTGWLEVRKGSESNVVGLPMELLKRMFAEITL